VTGIQGRRCKQLLDDLTKKGGYRKLDGEALDVTLWRTRSERGWEPFARQTTDRITYYTTCRKSRSTLEATF